MKEKYLIEENEHFTLLNKLYKNIQTDQIKRILDCGTGKTSLSSLLENFKNSSIDAIVYYNDQRKLSSIRENISSKRTNIIEKDICKDTITKQYDLVLAHLLLGESIKWGNTFEDVFKSLININKQYLIIVDFKEDPTVNYEYLNKYLNENNYEIISIIEQCKTLPQKFTHFMGKTYIGYVIRDKQFKSL